MKKKPQFNTEAFSLLNESFILTFIGKSAHPSSTKIKTNKRNYSSCAAYNPNSPMNY